MPNQKRPTGTKVSGKQRNMGPKMAAQQQMMGTDPLIKGHKMDDQGRVIGSKTPDQKRITKNKMADKQRITESKMSVQSITHEEFSGGIKSWSDEYRSYSQEQLRSRRQDSSSSDNNKPPEMTVLEKLALAVAMKECLTQLDVLEFSLTTSVQETMEKELMPLDSWLSDQKTTRDAKEAHSVIHMEVEEPPSHLNKLQVDRTLVAKAIDESMSSLWQDGDYTPLESAVTREIQRTADEGGVVESEEAARQEKEDLQQNLADFRVKAVEELLQAERYIAELKDNLQEMKSRCALEERYVFRWNDAALSECRKELVSKEKDMRKGIQNVSWDMTKENYINNDVEGCLSRWHKELEEVLEVWMAKHEHDVEERDAELDRLKRRHANNEHKLDELNESIREAKEAIAEERARRRQIGLAELRQKVELRAAITIQRWYREILKKRKKGKKGKEKEKKK